MKRLLSRFPVALTMLFAAAACDDGVGPDDETLECATSVTAAQADSWVELCQLDEPVRHVRIENFRAPRTHAFAQIVFGFDSAPTVTGQNAEFAADQFSVLLYGGGMPAPPPQFQATFGATDISLGNDTGFINEGGTVCFDLHAGTATTAPWLVMWVDGYGGADCESRSTLTQASSYVVVVNWEGSVGMVDMAGKMYFRQSAAGGTTPIIRLFADPVLSVLVS